MEILKRKAAQQIKHHLEGILEANAQEDNLHDLGMWLDANKQNLPDKSEVEHHELFTMIESLIKSQEKISTHLQAANEWCLGLIQK